MESHQTEQKVSGKGSTQLNSILTAIPGRAKSVLLNPVRFYATEIPRAGGYLEPLLFMVVMAVITALIMALTAAIGFGPVGMMAMGFAGVIMLPIMVAIFGFIAAAIVFVIWKIMGSTENFETAYRCVAFGYAYAPVAALVGGIPYVGVLVTALWPLALMAIASIHVHKRKASLSWAVFGILGVVMALSGLNAEFAGRRMAGSLEGWSQQMDKKYGNPDEMTPEEAGKAVGDFLKGMQQQKGEK